MKLTKTKLNQLIKEEITKMQEMDGTGIHDPQLGPERGEDYDTQNHPVQTSVQLADQAIEQVMAYGAALEDVKLSDIPEGPFGLLDLVAAVRGRLERQQGGYLGSTPTEER